MRRGETEQLIRLLAGELAPDEAAALSARLRREPELAAAFRRLEAAWRAAAPAPPAAVPAWFAGRVMARVRREAGARLSWSAAPPRVRAAGAAALMAGLALGVGLATLRQATAAGAAPPAMPPVEIAGSAGPVDGHLVGSLAEAYLDAVAAAEAADGGGPAAGRGRS